MELVFGIIILVPIILGLFDLGSIITAVSANDSLCREACREAAAGPPANSKRLVEQLIDQANRKGGGGLGSAKFSLPEDPKSLELKLPPPEQGGMVQGRVQVKTQVDVHPPFLVSFLYQGQPLKFIAVQTFPYTYVFPPPPPTPDE